MMESSKEGVASRGEEGGREAADPGEGNPFPALEALSGGLVVRRSCGGDAGDGDRERWEQRSSRRHSERGGPRAEERATWRGGSRAAAEGRDDGGVSAAAAREEGAGDMEEDWDRAEASPGGAIGRRTRGIERDVASEWGSGTGWRRWRRDRGREVGSGREVGASSAGGAGGRTRERWRPMGVRRRSG